MGNQKVSKTTVLYYSLLAIPLAIVGLPLYIYLPTFYTTEIAIDISQVGLILFIARLTDVFTDPYFGYLSDKSVEHFKSRKPIMILGAIILIVSFYALLHPNLLYPKLWLFSFTILIYIAWSMINIPYLTWSSEISTHYDDKTLLNSSRELFSIVGVLIALTVPYLYQVSENPQKTLEILYVSFIFLFIPFFVVSLLKIKIKIVSKFNKFSFRNIIELYRMLPDLKFLQLGYLLNNIANALPATLFLLYIELIIEEKNYNGIVLIIYFLSGIIALPFWNILANKIGKKISWISSILLASCAFIFVPFLEAGDLKAFIIISIISGLSLGADMALPTSLQSDLVQKAKRVQSNTSGLLFGIWTMITKFSLALAIALGFLTLGAFNFEATDPNTNSLIALSLLYGFAPVAFKILALIFIIQYTDEKQKK